MVNYWGYSLDRKDYYNGNYIQILTNDCYSGNYTDTTNEINNFLKDAYKTGWVSIGISYYQ